MTNRITSVLVGLMLAATGCSSGPSMVLDSDLPAVPGLQSVYARNLDRSGGVLTGGRIVFRGRIDDAGALLDRTIALYSASGWSVLEQEASRTSATAVVERGDRRCTISINANRIDPSMSQAQLVLGRTSTDEAASSS